MAQQGFFLAVSYYGEGLIYEHKQGIELPIAICKDTHKAKGVDNARMLIREHNAHASLVAVVEKIAAWNAHTPTSSAFRTSELATIGDMAVKTLQEHPIITNNNAHLELVKAAQIVLHDLEAWRDDAKRRQQHALGGSLEETQAGHMADNYGILCSTLSAALKLVEDPK